MSEKSMNRLAGQQSPYLLQHQNNPVWWQPWDTQALKQAQLENKPIFLSIGYSTCHWCHVMEHESFEDVEVARLLNDSFVSIKVDREERPDLDDIYMTAVTQMTGQGGWPMSVWLTPELKPFFGGTYFPKPVFAKMLSRIADLWQSQSEKLREDGERVHHVIAQVAQIPAATGEADEGLLAAFLAMAAEHFEPKQGGFGKAPKFPPSLMLMALLRIARRSGDAQAEAMVTKTLDAMLRGGIYDQLQGGFHRYATDSQWLVPHFEKMLYDNALLAMTYIEAFQYFGDPDYERVARETLDYVLREMTSAQGAFYSAQDADSFNPQLQKKQEGYFATFSWEELNHALAADELAVLGRFYGGSPEGHIDGRNILHLQQDLPSDSLTQETLDRALGKLRQLRLSRAQPHLDDKVITEWNGLMIAALAKAAQVFADQRYLEGAQRAADFVLTQISKGDGSLWRRWREGEAGIEAYADDYAAMIHGLLHLYESDFDPRWLREAERLQECLNKPYWDEQQGGYYRDTGLDSSVLIRIKDDYDGVTPTANALSSLNLLKLYALTAKPEHHQRALKIFKLYQPLLEHAPISLSKMMIALDFEFDAHKEIAVVFKKRDARLDSILRALRYPFSPNQVVVAAQEGQSSEPLLKGREARDGEPTVYICREQTCQAPMTDARDIERAAAQFRALKISAN